MIRSIAAMGVALVGFALPANLEIDVCSKGTVIDVNTGETICVGPVVERGRTFNLQEFIEDCLDENPDWHGIGEVRLERVVCW